MNEKLDSDTDNNTIKSIVCIQLPPQVHDEVEKSDLGIRAKKLFFLDQKLIISSAAKSLAVFISWDGVGGKAVDLISSITTNKFVSHVPIYLFVPPNLADTADSAKKLKIKDLLYLPKDLFKIQMLMYDIVNVTETDDTLKRTKKENLHADFDLSTTEKIDNISKIKCPPTFSETKMFKKFRDSIKAEQLRAVKLEEEKELREGGDTRPVLIFAPTNTISAGLQKSLKTAGFLNTFACHTIAGAFKVLRCNNIAAVLVWHDQNSPNSIDFIRELNENRRLPRSATMVMSPGEESLKHFAANSQQLFVDHVCLFQKHSKALKDSIDLTIAKKSDVSNFSNQIFKIRRHMRIKLPGFTPKPITNAEFEIFESNISLDENFDYWISAEKLIWKLKEKDLDAAEKSAIKLNTNYSKRIDALILTETSQIKEKGLKGVADSLTKKALRHKEFSLEKAATLGHSLIRFKSQENLEKLIIYWHNREDFPCDDQFYLLVANWYALSKDEKKHLQFLGLAIDLAPLDVNLHFSLVKYYTSQNNLKKVSDVWRICSDSGMLRKEVVNVLLAKSMASTGNTPEAMRIVDEVLNTKPNFSMAIKLKEELSAA